MKINLKLKNVPVFWRKTKIKNIEQHETQLKHGTNVINASRHLHTTCLKHLKTFKQISQNGDYPTIEAPNCPNMPRKFCDITGNLAKYRDPKT